MIEDWLNVMIPVRWSELLQSIKPFGETDLKELLRDAGAEAGFSAAQLERDGVSVARVGGLRDFADGELFELPHSSAKLSVIFDAGKAEGVDDTIRSLANILDLALLVEDRRSGYAAAPMMDPVGAKDRLTNTIDRDGFTDFLNIEFASAPSDATLIMLGVDGMETVNATLGHSAGDAVLSAVADRLRETLRSMDTVSRLGGDVFGVYCPNIGTDTATNLTRRLQSAIRAPIQVAGNELRVTAGAGLATRSRGEKAQEIISHGDMALRASKSQGPGELSVYDGELRTRSEDRRQLAAEFVEALAENQLSTGLNPIVHLPVGTIVAFEAHVVWNHPTRGEIQEAEFLDLAELIGRVSDVERAVLEFAMADDGTGGKARTGMKLSASTLRDPKSIGWIVERLASGTSKVMFEVGEEAVSDGGRTVQHHLDMLRRAGASLVLHDFGKTYGALRTLHTIPFDGVKLHSSILDPEDPTRSASVAKAIYASSKELGFDVVHSGVDSDADLRLLLQLDGQISGHGFFAQGKAVHARVSSVAA